jgi:hypothetical protein
LAHTLYLPCDICSETKHAEISPMLALPARAIPHVLIPPLVNAPTNRADAGNVADPLRTATSDETRFIPNRTNRAAIVKSIENRPSGR